MLDRWLTEELPGASVFVNSPEEFALQFKDLQLVISRAPATMPGPDGIPYVAWKRMGVFGAEVLFAAAKALGQEGAADAIGKGGHIVHGYRARLQLR